MTKNICLFLTTWGGLLLSTAAADGPATRPEAATRPAGRVVTTPHMKVDLDARQVVLSAEVCNRNADLEFLLCFRGTKEHESILSTQAKPSSLHAALLMLGLMPGKYAKWFPEEDGVPERVIPPRGPEVKVELRWKDKTGQIRTVPASQWLKVAGTGKGKPTPPDRWVFVGSDLLDDNRYWADVDGQIISVANFTASVLDVPFESSSSKDLEDPNDPGELSFQANTAEIPSLGTPVEVVLTPLPGAEKCPHVRVSLEIDRLGRFWIDGQPIVFDQLRKWAEKYIEDHAKGQVVIRCHARSISHDVTRVREEIRIGGVFDVEEVRLGPSEPLLPRTPQQAAADLAEWRNKFARPKDYIFEPGGEADEMLRVIDRNLGELEAQKRLLEEYRMNLSAALKDYKAATQPASPPATAPAKPTAP